MSSAWPRAGRRRKAEPGERRSGWWTAFRDWRRSRPFWAGVWTLLAGVEILSIPFAPLPVMMHEGVAGVAGSLMGIFLVVLALSLWLAPGHRVFAGIATLVLAVASLVLSNFGGFLIGFLLGVTGGAMAVSWVPYARPPVRPPVWPDWARGNGWRRNGGSDGSEESEGSEGSEGPDGWEGPDGSGGPGGGSGGSGGSGGPGGPGGSGGPGGPGGSGGPGGPGGSGGPGGPGGSGRSDGPDAPGASGAPDSEDGGSGGRTVGGREAGSGPRTNPLTWRTSRLRALGVLPIGALLTGGLQPAPAHLPRVVPSLAGAPSVLGRAADDKDTPPDLTVCSLLDGLLTGIAPGTRGTSGSRVPSTDGPPGRHASPNSRVPKPRTDAHDAHRPGRAPESAEPEPEPAPTHSSGAGLLGSVADLLGLHGSPDAGDEHREHGEHGKGTAAQHDGATPRPSRPAGPSQRGGGSGGSGGGTGKAPSQSVLRLDIPPLPADGRMDGSLSLLPLRIDLGGPSSKGGRSPWCLPQPLISLRLGVDAAAYGVRTAAQPFRVLSPLMVLTGLTYHGITAVPTASGSEEVLVFTASRVDIASLRETAPLLAPRCGLDQPPPPEPSFHGLPGLRLPLLDMGVPGIGRVDPAPGPWYPCQGTLETDGAPAATSVATGEPVVLLTKVLSGNLLGLLPVTFSPSMPPPLPPGLTLPIPIFFTDVTAYNQFLGADELDVPGLHQTASR